MIKIGVPMVFRFLMRKCYLYICEFDKVYLAVWSGVVLLLCGSLSNGWGKTSHSRAVSCHQDLQLLWTFQGHWCGMILCFLVHRASLPDGFCWFCRRRLFKFKCKCPVCSLEKDAKDTSNQCLVSEQWVCVLGCLCILFLSARWLYIYHVWKHYGRCAKLPWPLSAIDSLRHINTTFRCSML